MSEFLLRFSLLSPRDNKALQPWHTKKLTNPSQWSPFFKTASFTLCGLNGKVRCTKSPKSTTTGLSKLAWVNKFTFPSMPELPITSSWFLTRKILAGSCRGCVWRGKKWTTNFTNCTNFYDGFITSLLQLNLTWIIHEPQRHKAQRFDYIGRYWTYVSVIDCDFKKACFEHALFINLLFSASLRLHSGQA